jgi:hypothetical protein
MSSAFSFNPSAYTTPVDWSASGFKMPEFNNTPNSWGSGFFGTDNPFTQTAPSQTPNTPWDKLGGALGQGLGQLAGKYMPQAGGYSSMTPAQMASLAGVSGGMAAMDWANAQMTMPKLAELSSAFANRSTAKEWENSTRVQGIRSMFENAMNDKQDEEARRLYNLQFSGIGNYGGLSLNDRGPGGVFATGVADPNKLPGRDTNVAGVASALFARR